MTVITKNVGGCQKRIKLLRGVFKTQERAATRAKFETAHAQDRQYIVERYRDDFPDDKPYDPVKAANGRYTYRVGYFLEKGQ